MKTGRILLTIAMTAGLGVALGARAAPADPHAVLADVGKVVSKNGIDESRAVEIGGIKQWIHVRGRDLSAPILLLIHGGPAAPDLPNSYLFERGWDDYFTVVEWDQRGAGKTYELNDPKVVGPTLHVERMVRDAEEMVAYLRKTYDRKKIFVMGHSWGTLVGLNLAERRPDWLYAYIGAGQVLDFVAQEKSGYAWVLAQANADGNAQAIKELEAIAPYPEADGAIPFDKINVERKWSVRYGGLTHGWSTFDIWENAERISPDYSEADFKAIDQGSAMSVPALLPEMMKTNLSTIQKLRVPLIMFAGRYDYTTPNAPVRAWYDRVQAPSKRWVWFENSAHMMYIEEPGRALVHLVQDALPLAHDAAGKGAPRPAVAEKAPASRAQRE